MSKTLNQLSFKDIIENALEYCHEKFQEDYDHDTESDYVPYGDTYVSSGNYITEESEERATQEWKDTFDVDEFVSEWLVESQDFRDMISEMVDEF